MLKLGGESERVFQVVFLMEKQIEPIRIPPWIWALNMSIFLLYPILSFSFFSYQLIDIYTLTYFVLIYLALTNFA